ncbi:hypothetical protein [Aromatoleum evansii]|uniref:hypothetical protein n=1 Tax=Aromatoleum evansii TaxID=59406 RepID=UPI00145D60E3|nr:hypothetical protein [Aromatoleum evansii]NMG27790.1 hypothetical protein [Aromatoleum evansii]
MTTFEGDLRGAAQSLPISSAGADIQVFRDDWPLYVHTAVENRGLSPVFTREGDLRGAAQSLPISSAGADIQVFRDDWPLYVHTAVENRGLSPVFRLADSIDSHK